MKQVLLLLFLFFSSASFSKEYDFDLDWETEWRNFASPIMVENSRYALLLGSAFSYLAWEQAEVSGKVRGEYGDRKVLKWQQVGDIAGWGIFQFSYIIPRYFYGTSENYDKAVHDAELAAKAVAYTALTTLLIKVFIDQDRPNDPNKHDSFPSGHASSAFAFSTVISLRHEWYWGVLANLGAAYVAFSRVDANAHWWHDSIFGAALGVAYGIGIVHNHTEEKLPYSISVAPTMKSKGMVFQVHHEF